MTKTRRGKPGNLAIAMAIIVMLLLAIGAYTNFFGVVQPTASFTTWPKVYGVWIGDAYVRSWQLGFVNEYKIATVNFYYRPVVWDQNYRKWREMNPPASVPITYYPTEIAKALSPTGSLGGVFPFNWLLDLGLNPNTVQTKEYIQPGTWSYDEYRSLVPVAFGGTYVKLRLDPDWPDDMLPDIAVYIKPLTDKVHPNGEWRWASYEVTVSLIGDSPREIATFYKNTHVDVLFDMYYLLREVRVNGEALKPSELWQDPEGRTKIQLLAPSKPPKEEPGDVSAIAYLFNFAPVTGEIASFMVYLYASYIPYPFNPFALIPSFEGLNSGIEGVAVRGRFLSNRRGLAIWIQVPRKRSAYNNLGEGHESILWRRSGEGRGWGA